MTLKVYDMCTRIFKKPQSVEVIKTKVTITKTKEPPEDINVFHLMPRGIYPQFLRFIFPTNSVGLVRDLNNKREAEYFSLLAPNNPVISELCVNIDENPLLSIRINTTEKTNATCQFFRKNSETVPIQATNPDGTTINCNLVDKKQWTKAPQHSKIYFLSFISPSIKDGPVTFDLCDMLSENVFEGIWFNPLFADIDIIEVMKNEANQISFSIHFKNQNSKATALGGVLLNKKTGIQLSAKFHSQFIRNIDWQFMGKEGTFVEGEENYFGVGVR